MKTLDIQDRSNPRRTLYWSELTKEEKGDIMNTLLTELGYSIKQDVITDIITLEKC